MRLFQPAEPGIGKPVQPGDTIAKRLYLNQRSNSRLLGNRKARTLCTGLSVKFWLELDEALDVSFVVSPATGHAGQE